MAEHADTRYWIGCVDDDQGFLESVGRLVDRTIRERPIDIPCEVELAIGAAQFNEALAEMNAEGSELAVLIADQVMPECSGLELIEQVREKRPGTSCVLLTGYAGMESARYAINHRLLDRYVSKPIENELDFAEVVTSELERFHLRRVEGIQAAQIRRQTTALQLANEHLEQLKHVAERVAYFSRDLRTLDLEEVLDLICNKAPELFGAKSCFLFVPDRDNQLTLWRERRVNCAAPVPPGIDVNRVLREAMATRRPAVATERGWCLGSVAEIADSQGCVVMPLWLTRDENFEPPSTPEQMMNTDTMPALLCLCGIENPGKVSRQVLEYKVLLINDILGANIANALAHIETDRLAHQDSLTSVRTRRVFDSLLTSEWLRFKRYDSTFAVILVDVDHLKEVNDTHGHAAGDEVLCRIAEVLDRESRRCDTVARYGGDEFAVICPETDIAGARVVADRIHAGVAQVEFSFATEGGGDGERGRPSVSIGVACANGKSSDAELLEAADRALYESKQAGRNRVSTERGA